jgi:hypothetical protein
MEIDSTKRIICRYDILFSLSKITSLYVLNIEISTDVFQTFNPSVEEQSRTEIERGRLV